MPAQMAVKLLAAISSLPKENAMNKQTRVIVALCVICAGLSIYNITYAVIAYIINSYSSYSAVTVSQLLTIPSISGLIASFLVGPLALKISKKILLLIIAGSVLVSFVIFFVVGGRGPFVLLLAAAVIAGIAQGGGMTIVSSIINDFFDITKSATYIALTTALIQGGSAVANFIAGPIGAGNNGTNWPYAYVVGLYLIPAMLIFAFMLPGKKASTAGGTAQESHAENAGATPEDSTGVSNGIPFKVFLMILMKMFFTLCMASFVFNLSTYIISEYNLGTSAQAGMVNSLYMICGMAAGFSYALWQKLLKQYIGIVGYAMLAIGVLVMMLINTTLAGVCIAAVVAGLGINLGTAFVMAKIMEITPKKMVPVSMSLLMGGVNIAVFISLYTLNFVGGLFGGGMHNTLLAGVIFGAIATVMSVFLLLPKKDVQGALPQ
jgi:MFS family permease